MFYLRNVYMLLPSVSARPKLALVREMSFHALSLICLSLCWRLSDIIYSIVSRLSIFRRNEWVHDEYRSFQDKISICQGSSKMIFPRMLPLVLA